MNKSLAAAGLALAPVVHAALEIDGPGLKPDLGGIVGVTVSRPGVAGSGSTFAENAEAQPVHVPPATMLLLR